MPQLKAKIFISCGQNKKSKEVEVANSIVTVLKNRGFETYLACEEHSSRGLKENIFESLENSEYFLFIDFKREKIDSINYRGSLYTNQELAIAIYLEKRILVFQESGIKQLDGMIGSVQLNPLNFFNKDDLVKKVKENIRLSKWCSNWKDKLSISIQKHGEDVDKNPDGRKTFAPWRHFYLKIENKNDHKIAFNCTAYLNSIYNETTKKELKIETIELKWKGALGPSVSIMTNNYWNPGHS